MRVGVAVELIEMILTVGVTVAVGAFKRVRVGVLCGFGVSLSSRPATDARLEVGEGVIPPPEPLGVRVFFGVGVEVLAALPPGFEPGTGVLVAVGVRAPVDVLPLLEGVGVGVAGTFTGPEGTAVPDRRVGVEVRVAVALSSSPADLGVASAVGSLVDLVCVAVALSLLTTEAGDEIVDSLVASGMGVSELSIVTLPDSEVGVSCVCDGDNEGLEGGTTATDVAVWIEKTLSLNGFRIDVRLKSTANMTAAATVPTNVNQVDGDEEKIQLRPLLLATVVVSGSDGVCVGVRRCAN